MLFFLPLDTAAAEAALFGWIGVGGEVKNLRLAGFDIDGTINVGALAGVISGSVDNVIVSGGEVFGDGDDIGALAGDLKAGATLTNSIGATDVSSSTANDTGGLVGMSQGLIQHCEGRGDISALGDDHSRAGGLAGACQDATCEIEDSVARGNVDASGDLVGGLVGELLLGGTVRDSVAYGDATSTPEEYVDGFVGRAANGSIIERCVAHGNATARRQAGGFIGRMNTGAIVRDSAAYGHATASDDFVGGFVGYISPSSGFVYRSFAAGDATGDQYVGGFAGYINTGSIVEDSYATGDVDGNYRAGGFIGRGRNMTARRCYSRGTVDVAPNDEDGDFMGHNEGNSFTSCYALNQAHSTFGETVSGSSTSGVSVKSSSQLQSQSTFSGWDFSSVWVMGSEGPELR